MLAINNQLVSTMTIAHSVKFWIISLSLGLLLSACTSTSQSDNTMTIRHNHYQLDEQGRVVLTQNEINQFQQQGQAIYINNVLPSGAVVMTAQEMDLLTSSPNALDQFIDNMTPKKPAFQNAMVSQGNVRLSIEKYASEQQWHVNYIAKEYLIEKPYLINAPDFESLILEIIAEFPVFVTFNTKKKIVFIQQQNQSQPLKPNTPPTKKTDLKITPKPKPIEEKVYVAGQFKRYMPSGRVSFKLSQGQLRPQVIDLLTNHQLIETHKNVKWLAYSNYQWSSDFEMYSPSLDELIEQILQTYALQVDFKANGIALITNKKGTELK
jgi:hypothetical protein